MKMSTFGPVTLNALTISSAVATALSQLGEKPKLAVIYPPIGADCASIVSAIKKVADVPVIGATTGGAGFTEKGIGLNALVGGFISGDDVTIQTAVIKDISKNQDVSLKDMAGPFTAGGKGGQTLFMLADPFSCDGEALIKNLMKVTPLHWRFLGGLAGDNWTFKGVKLIYNDLVFSGGAVFAYINSDVVPAMSARHGFSPIAGGKEMKITSIDGARLQEIDGKPAVEVYRSQLESLGLIKPGADVVSIAASYPIGVKTIIGERFKIRTPMSIDGGTLVLAGSLANGDKIQMMHGTKENMIAAAKEMTEAAMKGLKTPTARLQLVIDCAGRKMLLGDDYKEQIKAFRVDPHSPMLGFSSYGEFARYGGSLEGFHNTTAVTAIW